MTTGPPDVVGVGFSKAGTSWWFSLISAHPGFHPPVQKELLFFNRHFFQRLRDGSLTDDQLCTYHQWFPRPTGRITGEWTPSYVFWYQLAPLLRRAAPAAKILVLVRDPVERYQSDISRRMPRQRLKMLRFRSMTNGMYSAKLEPWIRVFPSSDVLVLQYEACVREPEEQLDATYRFLGLDPSFRPPGLRRPVNKTKVKRTMAPDFRRMLTEQYEPDVVRLAERYPQIDLRLWPNFSHLASSPDGSD